MVQFGRTDAYGRPPAAPLGLLCVLVLGPPLLLVLGSVHTFLMTMPSDLAAHAAVRRTKGALGQWQGVVVLGAAYATALAAAGAPFLHSWAWIAASGALPLLGVAWFHRGERKRGRATAGARCGSGCCPPDSCSP
ncbi:hypothetical protein OG596_15850 [Streptomyces sp. NBC_01102]|uniref:hypothetical protein n=1 Tax=unclassified Streptomyces TaxID=2593676 RepID=UPI0038649E91|nr:hypothetical protein OG596_15850 [Streptomyces sp. NBC_01102]